MARAPEFPELAPHRAALRVFLDRQVEAFEPEVRPMVREALAHPGKLLRPTLLFASAFDGRPPSPEIVRGAAVVELVHLATLVHDDVLDGADTRHGSVTPNRTHGAHAAILFGDALFAHALVLAAELPSPELCRLVATGAREVCSGEVCQTFSRGKADLSLDDYLRHIRLKTAELFAAACRSGAHLSGHAADHPTHAAVAEFGLRLGIAYQIYDDLADILLTSDRAGKTLGTDAASGKLTLPLLLERDAGTPDAVARVLRGEDLRKVVAPARWAASFATLGAEIAAAETALRPLGNPASAGLLLRLTDFLKAASDGLRPLAPA
jgi:octaprenyl-diphosphate synthase